MSLSGFVRGARRPAAAACVVAIAVTLAIGLASAEVAESRHGVLWLATSVVAFVLLAVLAALPRLPISLVWSMFLVAAWCVAAASGPGLLGSAAQIAGFAVAVTCVAMATCACVVHYDIAQSRPVSRL